MKVEAWVGLADKALSLATEQIQLIRSLTPRNADAELCALEQDYRAGHRRLPDWQYQPSKLRPELLKGLEQLAGHLDVVDSPLSRIYAARARELALEGALIEEVGTAGLSDKARLRFVGSSADDDALAHEARSLALSWLSPAGARVSPDQDSPGEAAGPALVRSCDHANPESLVSAMARGVGRAHLPIRVIVQPGLASLAATGDGFIVVAEGRWLSARATARTVLHEIAGHALPRARASAQPLRIFALGTARGVDDQEGRALLIERAAGFLDYERRTELALRHLGAELALAGASLVDTVDLLLSKEATLATALRIAVRVHRGGSGRGGLGREVVYLTALLRVERALVHDRSSAVERVMSCGRVAAAVAPVLAEAVHHAAGSRIADNDLCRLGPSSTI
jgi:hypothetical protein